MGLYFIDKRLFYEVIGAIENCSLRNNNNDNPLFSVSHSLRGEFY